jgi:uncharacterized lipoprotein YmbA
MKKWLLMVGALLLTACSSGVDNKSYYQLPVATHSGGQSTASQGNRQLWVEQVAVPDYLAGNGVVYQTSDVKYVIATTTCGPARWISSCATRWWPIWAASFRAGLSLRSRWVTIRIR